MEFEDGTSVLPHESPMSGGSSSPHSSIAHLALLRAERDSATAERDMYRSRVRELLLEVEELARQRSHTIKEKAGVIRALEAENERLRSDAARSGEQAESTEKELERVSSQMSRLREELTALRESHVADRVTYEYQLGTKDRVIEALQSENSVVRCGADGAKEMVSEVHRLQSKLISTKADNDRLRTQQESRLLGAVFDSAMGVSDSSGSPALPSTDDVFKTRRECAYLRVQNAELSAVIAKLQESFSQKEPAIKAALTSVDTLRVEIIDLKESRDQLRTALDFAEASEGKERKAREASEAECASLKARLRDMNNRIALLLKQNDSFRRSLGISSTDDVRRGTFASTSFMSGVQSFMSGVQSDGRHSSAVSPLVSILGKTQPLNSRGPFNHHENVYRPNENQHTESSNAILHADHVDETYDSVVSLVADNSALREKLSRLSAGCETEAQKLVLDLQRRLGELSESLEAEKAARVSDQDTYQQALSDALKSAEIAERSLEAIKRSIGILGESESVDEVDVENLEGVPSGVKQLVSLFKAQLDLCKADLQGTIRSLNAQISNKNELADRLNEEVSTTKSSLENEVRLRRELDDLVGKLREDDSTLRKRLHSVSSELEELKDELMEKTRRVADLETSLTAARNSAETATIELNASRTARTSLETQLRLSSENNTRNEEAAKGLRTQLDSLTTSYESRLSDLHKLYAEERERNSRAMDLFNVGQREVVERNTLLSATVTRLEAQYESLKAEKTILLTRLDEANLKLKLANANIKSALVSSEEQERVSSLESDLEVAKQRAAALDAEVTELSSQLDHWLKTAQSLEKELQETKEDLKETKEDLSEAQAQAEAAASSEDYGAAQSTIKDLTERVHQHSKEVSRLDVLMQLKDRRIAELDQKLLQQANTPVPEDVQKVADISSFYKRALSEILNRVPSTPEPAHSDVAGAAQSSKERSKSKRSKFHSKGE